MEIYNLAGEDTQLTGLFTLGETTQFENDLDLFELDDEAQLSSAACQKYFKDTVAWGVAGMKNGTLNFKVWAKRQTEMNAFAKKNNCEFAQPATKENYHDFVKNFQPKPVKTDYRKCKRFMDGVMAMLNKIRKTKGTMSFKAYQAMAAKMQAFAKKHGCPLHMDKNLRPAYNEMIKGWKSMPDTKK